MKYEDFVRKFAQLPCIDLATVVQTTEESRSAILMQLHRWAKTGRLIQLRRGYYILPEPYTTPNPALLANAMYAPSYLTSHWALSFYGMIPEHTVIYTSATTRKPACFENPIGVFRYRNIKQSAFFGYRSIDLGGAKVMLAEPEKALLDLWHLMSGPWPTRRMEEMRFQNTENVNAGKLEKYAEQMASPRILRAVSAWIKMQSEEEGSYEL